MTIGLRAPTCVAGLCMGNDGARHRPVVPANSVIVILTFTAAGRVRWTDRRGGNPPPTTRGPRKVGKIRDAVEQELSFDPLLNASDITVKNINGDVAQALRRVDHCSGGHQRTGR